MDHFLVVGCRQYGDWSYIAINERGYHKDIATAAEAFARDMKREDYREHVHTLSIPHEDPCDSAQNAGPWVCVFLREGFWCITSGFHKQPHAEQHAANILRGPRAEERKITNVSVRRLPLPEGA